MKFKPNHGHYVGQIYREGNHFMECVFVCGPLYDSVKFKVNSHFWPTNPRQNTIRIEELILRGVITR